MLLSKDVKMTIVVTDNCQGCRYTECVTFCPVACFHLGEEMLYIDPVECIECRACIPACPVGAIYDTDDLPEEKIKWVEINEIESSKLPVISDQLSPLPTAEIRRASFEL